MMLDEEFFSLYKFISQKKIPRAKKPTGKLRELGQHPSAKAAARMIDGMYLTVFELAETHERWAHLRGGILGIDAWYGPIPQ